MKSLYRLTLAPLALGLPVILLSLNDPSRTEDTASQASKVKYLGAKACKNCHSAQENGESYQKWEAGPHAKAFETLGSPEAKAIGKKMGIDDPQKSDKCLACHVTGHGADKKLTKKIKAKDGVQCESCHGPGATHQKKRMIAAMKPGYDPDKVQTLAEGEVIRPAVQVCLACHNKESPTFKLFCFKERRKAIRHLDPRRKRTEAELKKLDEECTAECPVCSKEKKGDAGKEGAEKKGK